MMVMNPIGGYNDESYWWIYMMLMNRIGGYNDESYWWICMPAKEGWCVGDTTKARLLSPAFTS